MDLLGKYGGPRATRDEVLQDGLVISRTRRPRPRHSAVSQAQAFDARAAYLVESDKGLKTQWSLQSLLYKLKELIQTAPWSTEIDATEREVEIEELIEIIGARGLTFEEHLEFPIRVIVRMGIFREIFAAQINDSQISSELSNWIALINSETLRYSKEIPELSDPKNDSTPALTVAVIGIWADNAPIKEVVSWTCPAKPIISLIREREPGVELNNTSTENQLGGKWLMDRFTETYLDRWDTDSLCREWSYLHGQANPPCSPFELKSREVKVSELSAEMADRLVKDKKRPNKRTKIYDSSPNLMPLMTAQLVMPAAKFLREGRRTEARALFEAILEMDPKNSDAHNNLGFCILPENPTLALKFFSEAQSIAGVQNQVLAVNTMLANLALGNLPQVLETAREKFGIEAGEPTQAVVTNLQGGGTYLWDIDSILNSDEPQLIEINDVSQYARVLVSTSILRSTS